MDTGSVTPVTLAAARAAAERLYASGAVIKTPLLRLKLPPKVFGHVEVHLKLESMQSISSFKVRGAAAAMLEADSSTLAKRGVVTASAGNMGQGCAAVAGVLGVACTVVVPDTAPATKLEALRELNATVIKVPYDTWWSILVHHPLALPALVSTGRPNLTISLPSVQEGGAGSPELVSLGLADCVFVHPVCDQAVLTGNASIGLEIYDELPDVDAVYLP